MIHLPKMKLTFVTVLAIALLPSDAIAGFTSNPALGWTQPGSQVIADLPPAPETGTPNGQRTPGGTRPQLTEVCKRTDKPLTALVPENGKGLTTAEHPSFWFYIPYAPKDIHSIEFSLHDRNETTTLYRTSFPLNKTPGVIRIPLPPSPEHSLKLNESYHWRFIVNCDRKATPEDNIFLDGWVTRVQPSPNLQNQVLWYDALTDLAKRYLREPQNAELKKAWTELLKAVGLEELAQAPLVSAVSDTNGIQLLGRYTVRSFPPSPEQIFF